MEIWRVLLDVFTDIRPRTADENPKCRQTPLAHEEKRIYPVDRTIHIMRAYMYEYTHTHMYILWIKHLPDISIDIEFICILPVELAQIYM